MTFVTVNYVRMDVRNQIRDSYLLSDKMMSEILWRISCSLETILASCGDMIFALGIAQGSLLYWAVVMTTS